MPRSSLTRYNNEKRGDGVSWSQKPRGDLLNFTLSCDQRRRTNLASSFISAFNGRPSSSRTRGFFNQQPSRTLNTVRRKAVAGLVWYPQLGLMAAPEIAAAVAMRMPGLR